MTRTLTLTLFPLLTAACIGQVGSGHPATEHRDATGAVGFHNATLVDAVVELDATDPGVELTCDDNLLGDLLTDVGGDGVLELRTRPGVNLVPRARCEAIVRLPELRSLEASGSGPIDLVDDADDLGAVLLSGSGAVRARGAVHGLADVDVRGSGSLTLGDVEACDLALSTSGSGAVRITSLTACALDSRSTGSGGVQLAGTVDHADVEVTGSGGFGDADLVATTATLRSTGSGGIELTVTDAVDVELTGSGGATVHGNPPDRDVRETGSGRAAFP